MYPGSYPHDTADLMAQRFSILTGGMVEYAERPLAPKPAGMAAPLPAPVPPAQAAAAPAAMPAAIEAPTYVATVMERDPNGRVQRMEFSPKKSPG